MSRYYPPKHHFIKQKKDSIISTPQKSYKEGESEIDIESID